MGIVNKVDWDSPHNFRGWSNRRSPYGNGYMPGVRTVDYLSSDWDFGLGELT